MKYLAIKLIGPDGKEVTITAPGNIPSGGIDLAEMITGNAVSVLFAIGVILALFYLIYGGIQWITSSGDKQKVAAARNRMIYAIIGLVIIFLSIFLVNLVLYIFGAPQLGK